MFRFDCYYGSIMVGYDLPKFDVIVELVILRSPMLTPDCRIEVMRFRMSASLSLLLMLIVPF